MNIEYSFLINLINKSLLLNPKADKVTMGNVDKGNTRNSTESGDRQSGLDPHLPSELP